MPKAQPAGKETSPFSQPGRPGAYIVKLLLHITPFALMLSLYAWCDWLANRRQPPRSGQQSFRAVLPYRIFALLLGPFLLLASWQEWGTPLGIIFLIMAGVYIPLGLYIFTLRITLDADGIRAEHLFRHKSIRFENILDAKLRTWTAEYVVRGRDGTKIVFPTWLKCAHYVIACCNRQKT